MPIYLLGYVGARKSGFIVHSVVRDHSNQYMEHSVVAGDGRFIGGYIKGGVSILYAPCRSLEIIYWYWKQPVGMPLTKEHLSNISK